MSDKPWTPPPVSLSTPTSPSSPKKSTTTPSRSISSPSSIFRTPRLRSAAWYGPFKPRALACCCTTTITNSDDPKQQTNSLAAVAGPVGIAVFQTNKPHSPLTVLDHVSPNSPISSLAFQSSSDNNTLLLAAARGCGVMVWDVSGRALSPLLGRINCHPSQTSDDEQIVGVAWIGTTTTSSSSSSSSSSPHLLTTSSKHISLWDTRSFHSRIRPSLRYSSHKGDSKFVHAASNDDHLIAAMTSSGVVRIYDDRVVSAEETPLTSYKAHDRSGLGIAAFVSDTSTTTTPPSSSSWITWGCDDDFGHGCAKLWVDKSVSSDDDSSPIDSDAYWYMGEGNSDKSMYVLESRFGSSITSCARVGPHPFSDKVVTVGGCTDSDIPPTGEIASWEAQLWRVDHSNDNAVDCMTTFCNEDRETLHRILGRKCEMGYLLAAEIGVGCHPHSEEVELQLCCLSSTGYVTVYAIPEAQTPKAPSTPTSPSPESPRLSILHRPTQSVVPRTKVYCQINHSTSFDESTSPRRTYVNICEDSTKSEETVQKNLRIPPIEGTPNDFVYSISKDNVAMQFDMDSPSYTAVITATEDSELMIPSPSDHHHHHPGTTPPVNSPQHGIANATKPDANAAAAVAVERKHSFVIDPIKASRVPCPRLSGASFGGVGGGGLIMFHNGDVRKIWNWFQKDASRAKQKASRMLSYNASESSNKIPSSSSLLLTSKERNVDHLERRTDDSEVILPTPRTMLDLIKMNAASKIAQWGDDLDDGNGGTVSSDDEERESCSSGGTNDDSESEEDESTSTDTDDDDESDVLYMNNPTGTSTSTTTLKPPLSREKSDSQRSAGTQSGSSSFTRKLNPSSLKKESNPFARPCSEPLEPVVVFSRQYDDIISNGQCPELARGWQLGAWWLNDEGAVSVPKSGESFWNYSEFVEEKEEVKNDVEEDGWGWMIEEDKVADGSESYRSIFPSVSQSLTLNGPPPGNFQLKMMRNNKSVPDFDHADNPPPSSSSSPHHRKTLTNPENEANIARSPKYESMIENLKKLFHNQQQDTLTMTPPDQSLDMLRRSNSTGALFEKRSSTLSSGEANSSSHPFPIDSTQQILTHQLSGIFTVFASPDRFSNPLAKMQLLNTKKICLHNKTVCFEYGQTEKADVWALLAQIVENLSLVDSDQFDGWGAGDGALGRELVENVLRYYEVLGDVQMLATIICVLSGGKDRRKNKSGSCRASSSSSANPKDNTIEVLPPSGLDLLLPDCGGKYDAYIHQYAALLYGWGLLDIRTELAKHIAKSIPGAGGEQLISVPASPRKLKQDGGRGSRGSRGRRSTAAATAATINNNNNNFISNYGVAPGLSFAPLCSRCCRPASSETNICKYCKDYGFHCSICVNAVRGLFTVCMTCGHGGHVNHIMKWFDENTVCPTGCGCQCVFNTFASEEKGQLDARTYFWKGPRGGGRGGEGTMIRLGTGSGYPPNAGLDNLTTGPSGSVPFGAYSMYTQGTSRKLVGAMETSEPIPLEDQLAASKNVLRRKSVL